MQKCFQDVNVLRKIIEDNQDKYYNFLYARIKRQQKDTWKRVLHTEIENHRNSIRQHTSMLDPYWSGKLVGEGIRRFEKEEILTRIASVIDSCVHCQSIDMTICIIQNALKDSMAEICSAIIEQVTK